MRRPIASNSAISRDRNAMKPLSVSDALFLLLEGRRYPMHVAGLQLYTMPEGAGPEFARNLALQAREAATPQLPFSRGPVRRMGRWHWAEDAQFDIDYHLRRSALPHPGRIRELLELVSRLHGALLDRTRPVWEMNIIEGLGDGRLATYKKIHHSMFDGVAAMLGRRGAQHGSWRARHAAALGPRATAAGTGGGHAVGCRGWPDRLPQGWAPVRPLCRARFMGHRAQKRNPPGGRDALPGASEHPQSHRHRCASRGHAILVAGEDQGARAC